MRLTEFSFSASVNTQLTLQEIRNEWNSDTPRWTERLRCHSSDPRPAGGVPQHATGSSSFPRNVAGAANRASGVKQLVACIDDIVVGHLSIQVTQRPRRSHVADFGICVDARWHNRGIASALIRTMIDMCDNWLRVDRIELTVFVDNEPAVAVYKKYGFEIEGTGKKYGLRNGEYVDAYFMARVK